MKTAFAALAFSVLLVGTSNSFRIEAVVGASAKQRILRPDTETGSTTALALVAGDGQSLLENHSGHADHLHNENAAVRERERGRYVWTYSDNEPNVMKCCCRAKKWGFHFCKNGTMQRRGGSRYCCKWRIMTVPGKCPGEYTQLEGQISDGMCPPIPSGATAFHSGSPVEAPFEGQVDAYVKDMQVPVGDEGEAVIQTVKGSRQPGVGLQLFGPRGYVHEFPMGEMPSFNGNFKSFKQAFKQGWLPAGILDESAKYCLVRGADVTHLDLGLLNERLVPVLGREYMEDEAQARAFLKQFAVLTNFQLDPARTLKGTRFSGVNVDHIKIHNRGTIDTEEVTGYKWYRPIGYHRAVVVATAKQAPNASGEVLFLDVKGAGETEFILARDDKGFALEMVSGFEQWTTSSHNTGFVRLFEAEAEYQFEKMYRRTMSSDMFREMYTDFFEKLQTAFLQGGKHEKLLNYMLVGTNWDGKSRFGYNYSQIEALHGVAVSQMYVESTRLTQVWQEHGIPLSGQSGTVPPVSAVGAFAVVDLHISAGPANSTQHLGLLMRETMNRAKLAVRGGSKNADVMTRPLTHHSTALALALIAAGGLVPLSKANPYSDQGGVWFNLQGDEKRLRIFDFGRYLVNMDGNVVDGVGSARRTTLQIQKHAWEQAEKVARGEFVAQTRDACLRRLRGFLDGLKATLSTQEKSFMFGHQLVVGAALDLLKGL